VTGFTRDSELNAFELRICEGLTYGARREPRSSVVARKNLASVLRPKKYNGTLLTAAAVVDPYDDLNAWRRKKRQAPVPMDGVVGFVFVSMARSIGQTMTVGVDYYRTQEGAYRQVARRVGDLREVERVQALVGLLEGNHASMFAASQMELLRHIGYLGAPEQKRRN
jgi:hypothetical protein